MPRPSNKHAPPTGPFDAAHAKAAWDKLLPRLEALDEGEVVTPPVDVKAAALAAHALAQRVHEPAVGARFRALPKEEFDPAWLDDLAALAGAAWHARAEYDAAQAAAAEPSFPEELVHDANEIKARMLRVATHYFEDDPDLGAEVKALTRKKHPTQLASELTRLARIYTAQKTVIEGDRKYYRATDADDATATADKLQAILDNTRGMAEKTWADRLARVWTLLHRVYEEVRYAGLYLFRREADVGERFPPIAQPRRPRTPRQKSEGEAGEAEAEPAGTEA